MMHAVDVAHAALCEAGRPDLADLIIWFGENEPDGGYIEVNGDILSEDDWDIVTRAESLARSYIGLAPYPR